MAHRRVNVRGIIFEYGTILAQTFRQKDGSESDHWGTPGGGLEEGESLLVGLQCEIEEETGVTPVIGKLLFIQQFIAQNGQEQLEFFFHVTNPEAFRQIDLTATSHGAEEIGRCEFIDPTTQLVLPAFLREIDIARHLADVKPVYLHTEL